GFEYVPIAEEVPRPISERQAKEKQARWRASPPASLAEAARRFAEQARLAIESLTYRRAVHAYLLANARSFRKYNWDLLVSDFHNPTGALVANKAGLRCLCLATALPESDRRIPPLWTDLAADNRLESLVRVFLEWQKQDALSLANRLRPDNVVWAATRRFYHITDHDLVESFAVPPLRVVESRELTFNLPTLIACPRAFDFDHPRRGNEHHVEPLVDLARQEIDFDWGALRPDRRLVYASMGTQSWLMRRPARFFQTLIDAFAGEPDAQLLLNVGAYFDPAPLRPAPNVTIVRAAPQLAVLARAALMITHGGLNSVKECIMHGVPMVVFPVELDQPGNAARVRHHGLGLSADYTKARAADVRAMCREVATNPSFSLAVRRMRNEFVRAQDSGVSAEIVEHVLSRPPPACP
ncbi:MAG TPA: nucleotide disphospho-sugar-binding domain-containing protein, partial [Polyangiaceae bacterium]|nr:nucleotide disphospho-sugar-binding domain-containing protein [Polyangiaceae bacterium]